MTLNLTKHVWLFVTPATRDFSEIFGNGNLYVTDGRLVLTFPEAPYIISACDMTFDTTVALVALPEPVPGNEMSAVVSKDLFKCRPRGQRSGASSGTSGVSNGVSLQSLFLLFLN